MPNKGQPFFFDSNFFDPEDPRYSPVDKTKPKLEFTREQLAQAKETAFESGKIAGFKEAQASLTAEIQKIVQKIDRDTISLHAQEAARAALYEAEAVRLSLNMIERIFPSLLQRESFGMIQGIIAQTLTQHREQNIIAIEVHPDLHKDLSAFIAALPEAENRLNVKSDPTLGRAACKILWANGGITYDIETIRDRIFTTIEESLAAHSQQEE